jgi:hypothetical protein
MSQQQQLTLFSLLPPTAAAAGTEGKVKLSTMGFRGLCRSVEDYEKIDRIGEGTYGIVCEWSSLFIPKHNKIYIKT